MFDPALCPVIRMRQDGISPARLAWFCLITGFLSLFVSAPPAGAFFQSFAPPKEKAPAGGLPGLADLPPTLLALRLSPGQRIEVDGKLDDPVWTSIKGGSGFRVWAPLRGNPPHEDTVFKAAYDEQALYFGVACPEPDPTRISKVLARRDRRVNTDQVTFYLDPLHDHATGYFFNVTSRGVQLDGVMREGENDDDSWDGVWQAETFQDGDGWYAEIRIPLSSIRYRADVSSWGLEVSRDIKFTGETDAWVVWDRAQSGFISRFGHLDGLHNIPAPRQLEILPYSVYRLTDPPRTRSLDRFENLGADLKYGLTAGLTLNATFQPDFGQVEADPALLNLTPYETFYEEKRPFFTEGAQYLVQPSWNMFYSRRIGTGSENARIRAAGKLTGTSEGGFSVGALAATTDVTGSGQTHNFFKTGAQQTNYFLGRIGRDFDHGKHYLHFMQTAVARPSSRAQFGDLGSREAYTSGCDFGLRFKDRRYTINGSFAGSIIDPERASSSQPRPAMIYGTGGFLGITKNGKVWSSAFSNRWVSKNLDLNDLGYLRQPDYLASSLWVGYRLNSTDQRALISAGNVNLNFNGAWDYSGRTGYDIHTGGQAWSYGRGVKQIPSSNINWYLQFRNFWSINGTLAFQPEGIQRDDTRNTLLLQNGRRAQIPGGGALIREPETYSVYLGLNSDSRRNLTCGLYTGYSVDRAHNLNKYIEAGTSWNQSSALHHELSIHLETRTDDTNHLDNFESLTGGIGGVSYVYGHLFQETLDATLRSSILFNRFQSLELYAQPYLTTGEHMGARELERADSYDLAPYAADGFNVKDYDFRYASVNLNAVYRWEYRPGSTFFLVWTHTRGAYDQRGYMEDPNSLRTRLTLGDLLRNEPENVFLAKITYWLPI